MRIRLSNNAGIFTYIYVASVLEAETNTVFYNCTKWEEVCDAYQLAGDGTYLGINLDWPIKSLASNIIPISSIPPKPGNLLKPRWDGFAWVEGMSKDELNKITTETKNQQLIALQIQRDAAEKLLLTEKVLELDSKISELKGIENVKS